MPKGSRRAVTKGTPHSKGGKGRKKHGATSRPAALTSKQRVSPPKSVSSTSTASPASRTQQIVPQPHILPDLKRIGIIAVAMILILIILYLVL